MPELPIPTATTNRNARAVAQFCRVKGRQQEGRNRESVQQFHFVSQFAFHHFSLQIEMQIWAQMRPVIPHLKPILNTSKLKIEIETKWYIFLSVKQLPQIARLKRKLR